MKTMLLISVVLFSTPQIALAWAKGELSAKEACFNYRLAFERDACLYGLDYGNQSRADQLEDTERHCRSVFEVHQLPKTPIHAPPARLQCLGGSAGPFNLKIKTEVDQFTRTLNRLARCSAACQVGACLGLQGAKKIPAEIKCVSNFSSFQAQPNSNDPE